MDLPHDSYPRDELEGVLQDLTLVNRYFGNGRAVLKHLAAMHAETADEGFTVLDVATGTADIPVTIAKWARQAGIRVGITAVDLDPVSIGIARQRCESFPEITLAVADGFALPFENQRFDYVLCSKTAHHFTEEKVLRMIKEFSRVARRGYIIVDLRRSWIAYILIFLLTRLFSRNRLSRSDGPLSVLKSFTPGELAALASRSGTSVFRVSKEPFWLMVLAGRVI
ncbi:MAG: methyltransferase domain-containing protein [Deltaproteobacteria bacterium]|uniref:methyltransferase domain-containing protein n=1 Tax=Candidatus Deferrimicrobium sp. TaxID=3060586 RepID=UPI002720263E|nr:methyltransferase domain-containing protein [Candidatus Deferrimicrobium sp.]MCR4310941.1 methyltransferase domain-containing protein [Deltaproteobacteria bacterium]MDO8738939.1 methyltransferase domain-containing protein [Candidatus Deferrimicrobium sp.]